MDQETLDLTSEHTLAAFQDGSDVLAEFGDPMAREVAVATGAGTDGRCMFATEDDEPLLRTLRAGPTVFSDGENSVSAVSIEGVRGALVSGPVTALFLSARVVETLRQASKRAAAEARAQLRHAELERLADRQLHELMDRLAARPTPENMAAARRIALELRWNRGFQGAERERAVQHLLGNSDD